MAEASDDVGAVLEAGEDGLLVLEEGGLGEGGGLDGHQLRELALTAVVDEGEANGSEAAPTNGGSSHPYHRIIQLLLLPFVCTPLILLLLFGDVGMDHVGITPLSLRFRFTIGEVWSRRLAGGVAVTGFPGSAAFRSFGTAMGSTQVSTPAARIAARGGSPGEPRLRYSSIIRVPVFFFNYTRFFFKILADGDKYVECRVRKLL